MDIRIKKIITVILLISSFPVFSQTNWSYQVWFNLFDSQGKIITKEDYKKQDFQILATNDKQHLVSYLNYNDEYNCFVFYQRTTSPLETLLIVNDKDTTIIRIPTQTFYAKEIILTPGYFRFVLDKNGNLIADNLVRDIFPNRKMYSCTNAFLDYLVTEYNKEIKLYSDNLLLIPLE